MDAAERLAARAPLHSRAGARALPALWLFTDPERTPDPVALALRLPPGAGVVFRGFGRPDAPEVAQRLGEVARARGLVFLVGASPGLAAQAGADGMHMPERAMGAIRRLRAHRPDWRFTTAAHTSRALAHAATGGADAAFVSPVFASRSPSAGAPLGPARLAGLVREARLPVFALGGVTLRTVRRLEGSGVAGFAAVDAFEG